MAAGREGSLDAFAVSNSSAASLDARIRQASHGSQLLIHSLVQWADSMPHRLETLPCDLAREAHDDRNSVLQHQDPSRELCRERRWTRVADYKGYLGFRCK